MQHSNLLVGAFYTYSNFLILNQHDELFKELIEAREAQEKEMSTEPTPEDIYMIKHVAPRYSFYIWYFVNILEYKFKKRILFKVTLLNEFFSFSEMQDLFLSSSQRH